MKGFSKYTAIHMCKRHEDDRGELSTHHRGQVRGGGDQPHVPLHSATGQCCQVAKVPAMLQIIMAIH
jgi:hypothetical protein